MRICSITNHQIVNNPRLFREADALVAAGHDVRVVAVRSTPNLSLQDEGLARSRQWRLQQINIERTSQGYWKWFYTGVRRKLATKLWKAGRRGERLAGFAYTRTFSETIRQILFEPTDLIIAHTQPMLAPAYFAAQKAGCLWGFDCEDILSEEYGEGIDDPHHQSLVRYVESRFIPKANYVTVASPLFGNWLRKQYHIESAIPVLNVCSLREGPEDLIPGYPTSRPYLSLHWVSISIGFLRGIEDAIRALPLIEVPVQLHLRGKVLPDYRPKLRALIAEQKVEDRVFIHERIHPQELIRSAAQHDIGLDLLQPCCVCHHLSIPNKLLAYMMAGLAIVATRTEGHESVLADALGAGLTYEPGYFQDLAKQINFLAKNPEKLLAFRRRSFELARKRFNWEKEKKRILDCVNQLEKRHFPYLKTSKLTIGSGQSRIAIMGQEETIGR